MKCINKMRLLCLCGIAAVFMSGCGQTVVSYDNPYDIYSTSADYGLASEGAGSEKTYFSQNLCVADDVNIGNDTTDSQVAEGAGTFNLATNTVTYAQNIYEKLYPASTTKILTAYIALKYGNLEDYVTVSENAADQASDSSVCGLKAGDVVQLKDLLYGMMLKSGNDAAIAIAEHIGGSVEGFADMMNQEALAMGASRSHFVNPNGLPDENHYTSVYDLYLIFQNAVQDQTFLDIISTMSYDVVYTDVNGAGVERTWENTNQYLTGKEKAPEGITVVGGKTGTTGAAGYCLVLYSYNASGHHSVTAASGNIVYLDKSQKHMYELNNKVRLINVMDYPIDNCDEFLGFLCGIVSQDHDLEEMYLDSFLTIAFAETDDEIQHAIEKLDIISEKYNVKFILSVSRDESRLPECAKAKIVISL